MAPRRRKQEQKTGDCRVCENATELDMDVIEKAFEETPSYEKKLQEAREKHLGTLVDFNTLEVIYEEDFVSEKALSTAWGGKRPDGHGWGLGGPNPRTVALSTLRGHRTLLETLWRPSVVQKQTQLH